MAGMDTRTTQAGENRPAVQRIEAQEKRTKKAPSGSRMNRGKAPEKWRHNAILCPVYVRKRTGARINPIPAIRHPEFQFLLLYIALCGSLRKIHPTISNTELFCTLQFLKVIYLLNLFRYLQNSVQVNK